MKRIVKDLSAITIGNQEEKRVRFSVTYAEDDGTPVVTEKGWTIDVSRIVRPPMTKLGRFYKTFIEASDAHKAALAGALNKMEFVNDVLGPQVESVDRAANETSEEMAEI